MINIVLNASAVRSINLGSILIFVSRVTHRPLVFTHAVSFEFVYDPSGCQGEQGWSAGLVAAMHRRYVTDGITNAIFTEGGSVAPVGTPWWQTDICVVDAKASEEACPTLRWCYRRNGSSQVL